MQHCEHGKRPTHLAITMADLQDPVLLKILIVEDMFSTEHEPRLQYGPIGPHTLNRRHEFKICALYFHAVALLLGVQISGVVELPAATQLDSLFVHVIDILPRYVMSI